MKKTLIYISLIVFAIGGCKKVDLDEVPSGDPVFTANATLDSGTQLNFVAGDDDFYMFSEFSKDNFDVYTMTGRFAKDANCQTDCEESLSFSIRSNYATPTVSDFIFEDAVFSDTISNFFTLDDSTLINGHTYSFSGELVDSFIQGAFYTWDIKSGNDPTVTYIGEFISHDYFGSEDLEVGLSVNTPTGCVSYFETIIPNGNNASNFCNLSIGATMDSMGNWLLTPSFGMPANDIFIWNGNPSISTPFVINPNSPPDSISLEASNGNCISEMEICTFSQGIFSAAFPQFQVDVQDTTKIEFINLGEQLSAVTIEYQDATGIYSSKFADNSNPNNTFTITKIEDYDDNENGEKTKKLTIDYNCILKEESSGEEKSISGTAEIAVAYPE